MAIIIDVTTRSSVYNPTSAQGQWYQHRWGRRDYPALDLTLDQALVHIPDSDESVLVQCMYGDAGEWKHIISLSDILGQRACVTTYGMLKSSAVKMMTDNNSMIHFKLDGIEEQCGKIHLGCNWSVVNRNLNISGHNACIEFYVYEHNQHQINSVIQLAQSLRCHLKFTQGATNDGNGCAIIDQRCNWLYDAISVPYDTPMKHAEEYTLIDDIYPSELVKHLYFYNSLRTFAKEQKHRSIHSSPLIANQNLQPFQVRVYDKEYNAVNGVYVTPSNLTFENNQVYTYYMYLICSDWKFDYTVLETNKENDFIQRACYYATRLQKHLSNQ